MKRKTGLLGVFALALFVMSVFLPVASNIGIGTGIQVIDHEVQQSVVASETGLEGRNSPLSMLM